MQRLCSWTLDACELLWSAPASTMPSMHCTSSEKLFFPLRSIVRKGLAPGPLPMPIAGRHRLPRTCRRSETTSVAPHQHQDDVSCRVMPYREETAGTQRPCAVPSICMHERRRSVTEQGSTRTRTGTSTSTHQAHRPGPQPMYPPAGPPRGRRAARWYWYQPAHSEPIRSDHRIVHRSSRCLRYGTAFPTFRFASNASFPTKDQGLMFRGSYWERLGVGVLRRPSAFSQSRRTMVLVLFVLTPLLRGDWSLRT
jgi:hypothetical protein